MLSDDELKEIEDRVAAASAGPWTIGFNGAMRSGWAVLKAGTSRTIFHLDPLKNIDLDEATHQVDADLDFVQYARSDVDALLADIKERKQQTEEGPPADDGARQDLQEAQVALMDLARRNEKLTSALEFYANLNNYRPPKPPPGEAPGLWIGNDLGRRAREALGQPETSPEPG